MGDFEAEVQPTASVEDDGGKVEEEASQRLELLKEGDLVFQDGQFVVGQQVVAPQGPQDVAGIVAEGFAGQLLQGIVVFQFFDYFFSLPLTMHP
jgi:hypothetical protein